METHTLHVSGERTNPFTTGMTVIYGLYGKCLLTGVESRTVQGERVEFYKLEVVKSNLSRSTKKEPAIWLPVKTAAEQGLRPQLSTEQALEVLKIFESKEYYFPLNESWAVVLPRLELTIKREGALGLAKVSSYLYVLKRRQVVTTRDLVKLQDNVNRILLKELSEATNLSLRELENQIGKSLRQKNATDH